MEIKRDKYFRERGSYSRIIKIFCKKCGKLIFSYQKDGPGWLKRCYFNRIISDRKFNPKRNLVCSCKTIIGKPKRHFFRSDGITPDGRWAFELNKESFRRTYGKKIE
jgi:hypothetical protein